MTDGSDQTLSGGLMDQLKDTADLVPQGIGGWHGLGRFTVAYWVLGWEG